MTDDRLDTAEAFLQEAVYRSRDRQALVGALARPRAGEPSGPGNCGLGARAEVVLDLSERGRELFSALWPDAPDEAQLERIRGRMREWVRRQDALDRKRNHFLKDFRNAHGFDRSAYSAERLAAYDAGLAEVNAEVDRERRLAARELLGGAGS